MKTPDFEHEIGVETYCTNHPGVEGKLRVRIDDFRVTELCYDRRGHQSKLGDSYPCSRDIASFAFFAETNQFCWHQR